jgi:hypothetical protein
VDVDEHQSVQRLLGSVPRDDVGSVDLGIPRLNTNTGRLAFSLMWGLGPLDLRTGELVDPAQVAQERMLAISPSNDPALGLANRLFHPHLLEAESISRLLAEAPEKSLHSHGFDRRALEALQEGDTGGFLEARAEVLARQLKDLWLERAAIGASDRPPIEALVSTAA